MSVDLKPRSKGSPLAAGGDVKHLLVFAALGAFVIYGVIRDAHADTMAQKVFGPWKSINVEQITAPVPEFEYPRTLIGSVSKSELYKPDPDACPVYESGKVVGFRFTCPASDRRAAHGGPLVPSASGS